MSGKGTPMDEATIQVRRSDHRPAPRRRGPPTPAAAAELVGEEVA